MRINQLVLINLFSVLLHLDNSIIKKFHIKKEINNFILHKLELLNRNDKSLLKTKIIDLNKFMINDDIINDIRKMIYKYKYPNKDYVFNLYNYYLMKKL